MLAVLPFLPSRYIQPFRYGGFAFSEALIQRNVAGWIVKDALFLALFPEIIPNPFSGNCQSFFIWFLHSLETD